MKKENIKMNLNYYKDYFIAVLFGEFDENDNPIDDNYCIYDIDEDSLIKQFKQLDKFFELANVVLERTDYTIEQACHDFYFTRQGHGVGFWENDHCEENEGILLTDICKKFNTIYTHVENGKVYID